MQDINLYHLLKFYAKKWKWITLLTILGALTGFVYNSYIQVPLYKSDATLILLQQGERKATQDTTLINNYIQLLKSRRVLEPVIEKQNNEISYEQLAASVTATNEKSTEVIKLSISSDNAKSSKALVDGTVDSFKNEVKEIYNLDNIRVVDSASMPSQPFNVNRVMSIAFLTLSGLLLSIIALFFVFDFRTGREKAKSNAKTETKNEPSNNTQKTVKDAVGLLIGAEIKKPTVKKKRVAKKAKANKRSK